MSPGTRTKVLFASIFFGLLLMGIGVYLLVEDNQFASRARSVNGKVIDFYNFDVDGEDGGYNTLRNPIIRYTVNDSSYTYRKPEALGNYEYQQDQEVELLVEAEHPENARIDNFNERWSTATLLIAVSFIPLASVFLILRFSK